jgi:hypothetical protein
MDFLFHVPFLCTAAGAVAEIQTVFCKYWVSWAQKADFEPSFRRASHFVKIIVACPHHLPKLPESTQRKQAIPNKGSLFYSHCAHHTEKWPNSRAFPTFFVFNLGPWKDLKNWGLFGCDNLSKKDFWLLSKMSGHLSCPFTWYNLSSNFYFLEIHGLHMHGNVFLVYLLRNKEVPSSSAVAPAVGADWAR